MEEVKVEHDEEPVPTDEFLFLEESKESLVKCDLLVYRWPGIPGLEGSSIVLGFLEKMMPTRLISGRCFGSACVHKSPMCAHVIT